MRTRVLSPAIAAIALAVAPAAASAAAPGVTTGGAAVTPSTATFTGRVAPNGRATTYWFEYGRTTALGSRTQPTGAGSGDGAVTAAGSAAGLAANTRYHYRLVARNADGTTRGARRTVRTRRAPLGLSLNAAPNPVPYGSPLTLAGILAGTGHAGRQVQILQNPFPYTGGFTPVGAPVVTNAAGGFAMALPPVTVTTQYRARLTSSPNVTSPVLTVPAAVRVSTITDVGRRRSDGVRPVRFHGSIRPARDGAQFAVQRRRGDRWVTVGGSITRHASPTRSSYGLTVRVRHSGTYRVFVRVVDGNLTSATGREVSIRLRPVS
jgi:hypothetical protein